MSCGHSYRSMSEPTAAPPLSLYVHVPWCIKKCPYCDFNSHQRTSELPEKAYVAALLNDLQQHVDDAADRPLASIFIGGGTPSLFSAAAITDLLEGISQRMAFDDDIEITLEANPGSAEAKRFAGYRATGVNRLSIGVQSFNDAQLQKLGRVHDATEAARAVDSAIAAGFDNYNIDLMHGLPGQTVAEAAADLLRALEFHPAHLSWYQLTVEPNTVFHSSPPILPDDDSRAEIQDRGTELLCEAGLAQYEVSAWSRCGTSSRHNLNYWLFGDYIGIGAGAHGKVTTAHGIFRTRKTRRPEDYLSTTATTHRESVSMTDLPLEFMMNVLRLNDGCEIEQFQSRTGLDVAILATALAKGRELGLLDPDPRRLRCTEAGHRYLNDTLALFLPA